MNREDRYRRILLILAGLYCFLSFTAVVDGFFITSGGPPGYLRTLWLWFFQFASSLSDTVLRVILETIAYGLALLFVPGIIGGILLVLAILCVLLIPGLFVALAVNLAAISITGAIIVFAIIGIVFTVLIRKYWQAIAEGIAWVTVLFDDVWKWYASVQEDHAQSTTSLSKRGLPMSLLDRFRQSRVLRANANRAPESAHLRPLEPATVLSAFRDRIRLDATTKALKSETAMVNGAVELGRAHLSACDLDTDWHNQNVRDSERTINQEIKLINVEDERDELLAKRKEKAQLPRNPTDRLFKEVYEPTEDNNQKAKVFKAKSRAEALIEAARIACELEEKIDRGPGTPQQKEDLKKNVRRELEDELLADAKSKEKGRPSASGYADDHEEL